MNPLAVKFGLPLSLYTYDESLRNKINSALYVASASGTITAPGELTFEYSDGDVTVRKTFRFDDTYVISMETAVTAERQAGTGFSHVAGGLRRPEHRPVVRLGAHRLHGRRQGRAPGRQEDQRRQHPARTLSMGRHRRTSTSRPSSCPTIPTQAAMVTFRNSIRFRKIRRSPIRTT